MNKIWPILIVLFILCSCQKEPVLKPKRLIEKEKMIDIIYDLSIIGGMQIQDATLLDSLKSTTNQYIFTKYKIDSIQFAQSNIYYAADYQEYEKMYKQVKARIDSQKLKITTIVKAQTKKDSLLKIRKAKLKLKKEADSVKKLKQISKLKKQADSIANEKPIKKVLLKDVQLKKSRRSHTVV